MCEKCGIRRRDSRGKACRPGPITVAIAFASLISPLGLWHTSQMQIIRISKTVTYMISTTMCTEHMVSQTMN